MYKNNNNNEKGLNEKLFIQSTIEYYRLCCLDVPQSMRNTKRVREREYQNKRAKQHKHLTGTKGNETVVTK